MMQAKIVQMNGNEMKAITHPVMALLNALQEQHPVDSVLLATLYALGAALASRGVILELDKPLRQALTPLVKGYQDRQQEKTS